jgi:hypothetical protein
MKKDKKNNLKSNNILYFNEFKKMKFKKFEVYLGKNKPTKYGYKNFSGKLIELDESDKVDLIEKKIFDVNEILIESEWESFKQLVQTKNNWKDLDEEINKLMKSYLDKNLKNTQNDDFELYDFHLTYLIDDEEKEIVDFSEKIKEIILEKLNYVFPFLLGSLPLFCLICSYFDLDDTIGLVLLIYLFSFIVIFIFPIFYKGLKDYFYFLKDYFKCEDRNENIVFHCLISIPLKIIKLISLNILAVVFIIIRKLIPFLWIIYPSYYIYNQSSFYPYLIELEVYFSQSTDWKQFLVIFVYIIQIGIIIFIPMLMIYVGLKLIKYFKLDDFFLSGDI